MGCTIFYGRICVTGGNLKCDGNGDGTFEPTSLCQEFSFTERKWKPLKNMNVARFGHCMCSFDQKPTKLFVYGGETENGDWTNSVEVYDPQKREWRGRTASKFSRYGSSCCIWKGMKDNSMIIVVGGQDENDESSKHVEIYAWQRNEWITGNDLNYEHGIFPAVWCDSDDDCIYVASSYIVIDNKNKQNSIIKYRVEMLDNPQNKWRIIESDGQFKTPNAYALLKSAASWDANAIRKSIVASIKVSR